MEKIKNFKVVTAKSPLELERSVNALIELGWTTTGGTCIASVFMNSSGGYSSGTAKEQVQFTQAMVQL